jgi:hypothetical protein
MQIAAGVGVNAQRWRAFSKEGDMSTPLVRCIVSWGVLAMVAGGCGTSPTGPSPTTPALISIGETTNYVLQASEGDTINADWQERYHAWAIVTLGVTPRQKILYKKYTSRAHMQAVAGVGTTNAFADPAAYAIHTIWPINNHEVVHLFTSGWGSPGALVNEGMAVAFQIDPARDLIPRWSGTPLHDLTRQFRLQNRFVPLARLTETASWRSQDPNVVYPESGSFMRWLIDEHGLDRIRDLYARVGGPNDSALVVRAAFAAVYGQSLDDLEQAWIAFVTR